MGELIVYQSLQRLSFRQSTISKSPLKPPGQLNSNFIWRLLRTRERKFCSNGPGHMTKMAATPIYGKNILKIFSRSRRPMTLRLKLVCSIGTDDHRFILTYLTSRSNLLINDVT